VVNRGRNKPFFTEFLNLLYFLHFLRSGEGERRKEKRGERRRERNGVTGDLTIFQ